jgi:hypothetical protein
MAKTELAKTEAGREEVVAVFKEALDNIVLLDYFLLESKLRIIEDIAQDMAKAGLEKSEVVALFEKPMNEARDIIAPESKALALSRLAAALAKAGVKTQILFQEAIALCSQIKDPEDQARMLGDIGLSVFKAGNDQLVVNKVFEGSLTIGRSLTDIFYRSRALAYIFPLMAKAGVDKEQVEKVSKEALEGMDSLPFYVVAKYSIVNDIKLAMKEAGMEEKK